MTLQQLQRGNELKNTIASLSAEKTKIEQANGFYSGSFYVVNMTGGQVSLLAKYFDFEKIKADALEEIDKQMQEAQTEFDRL